MHYLWLSDKNDKKDVAKPVQLEFKYLDISSLNRLWRFRSILSDAVSPVLKFKCLVYPTMGHFCPGDGVFMVFIKNEPDETLTYTHER